MTWIFEDYFSGNSLKLNSTKSATGFCIILKDGTEIEATVVLNEERLKNLKKVIALEIERLSPKTRKFCGNREPHDQHTYNAPGPKSSYQYDCLGF